LSIICLPENYVFLEKFTKKNKGNSSLTPKAVVSSQLTIYFKFVDAKSVVERRHVINGLSVDVTLLHKDSKIEYYRDRFLIKGLQKNISDEFLLYFIKAVTGMKPKFLAFHKTENDVALVIMGYDLGIYIFML
jgi:hypothetical protein